MEPSFLASWQLENFSTAELSPPVSPASPQSPLFYDGVSSPASPNTIKLTPQHQQQSQKAALSSVGLSSRAQAATNMLNELEQMHFVEQNAFGMCKTEESVDLNLDLFEELQDIEFTPTVLPSSEEKFEVPSMSHNHQPVSSPIPILRIIPNPPRDTQRKVSFSEEYKSILESLSVTGRNNNSAPSSGVTLINGNNNVNAINSFGGLFQCAGIPTTTVIGDECLVPVEFIGRPSAKMGLGAEEAESMDLDGIIISDDIALINESELFSLSAELASQENSNSGGGAFSNGNASTLVTGGALPSWAKELTIPLDSLDNEMSRNNDALDALLKGDVFAAKNVIASPEYSSPAAIEDSHSPVSVYEASDNDEDDSMVVQEEQEQTESVEEVIPEPVFEAKKKPERRGRKPAKGNKDSLTYIKDKSLRKKQQNKTAATRYRQKKKQELAVTLAEEDELQLEHDDLEKQRDKLKSEVNVIRSLLREMLKARKQRVSPASISITASSLVQAQRIARNRK